MSLESTRREKKDLEENNEDINNTNLYDIIQNPFDDNETLKAIIDIFTNEKYNIDSEYSLYQQAINYGNEEDDSKEEYERKFLEYILRPYLNHLYSVIKKFNPERYDEVCEKTGKYNIATMYPLKSYQPVLEQFNTYSELEQFYIDNGIDKIRDDLLKMMIYPSTTGQKVYEGLIKEGYTDSQIKNAELYVKFINQLKFQFSGGMGVMGFHIYESILNGEMTEAEEDKNQIKFYLNAGPDTYKVAQIFQQKCVENNIHYMFKVVDATLPDEYKRNDKMCIYSSLNDSGKIVNIIREIKRENPEIIFRNPPIFSGKIDGYIGVGQDRIMGQFSSYNQSLSLVCYQVLAKVFGNTSRDRVEEYIKEYPESLNAIGQVCIQGAKQLGLSGEKICIKRETEQVLKQVAIPSNDEYKNNKSLKNEMLLELLETQIQNQNNLKVSPKNSTIH